MKRRVRLRRRVNLGVIGVLQGGRDGCVSLAGRVPIKITREVRYLARRGAQRR